MRLLIAYSACRPPGRGLRIYFDEHQRAASGHDAVGIDVDADGSRLRPDIPAHGRYCVFSYQRYEAVSGGIRLWDREDRRYVPLPGLDARCPQMQAAISGDGRWIVYSALERSGGAGG